MRAILFILALCFIKTALAAPTKTVIFNMSDKYDIEATYRVCFYQDSTKSWSCKTNNTVLIKAKNSPQDQNYIVITESTIEPGETAAQLQMISAIEKDETGKIVAQEKYMDEARNITSNCIGILYRPDDVTTPNIVADTELVLNDMHQSPSIVCSQSFFAAPP